MGKLEEFKVIFDHPQGVHFAGQWVRGTVIVHLSQRMEMRGISVNLIGRAKVHWHTYHNKNRKDYRSEEVYFDENFALSGLPVPGRDVTVLEAGRYEYPFEFLLLADLPSSFEGEFGYVRYVAIATIDKPWKFDHVTKEAFTVLGSLDLNHEDSSTREPFTLSSEETVSCCCCVSGSVEANVTINKRCFVPGETIYINGEIANNTNTTVRRCRASLKQYITFSAASTSLFSSGELHTKTVTSYEVKVESEAIRSGQVDKWINVPLVIPSLPPSRLDGCGIIDIAYKFKFYVDVDYTNIKLDTAILVGTIPLHGTFYSYPPPSGPSPAITQQPSAPMMGDFEGSQPYNNGQIPSDYYAPLPTYEECVMGKVQIKEEKDSDYVRGNLVWAPMYTTYQFPVGPGGDARMLPMSMDDGRNNQIGC